MWPLRMTYYVQSLPPPRNQEGQRHRMTTLTFPFAMEQALVLSMNKAAGGLLHYTADFMNPMEPWIPGPGSKAGREWPYLPACNQLL